MGLQRSNIIVTNSQSHTSITKRWPSRWQKSSVTVSNSQPRGGIDLNMFIIFSIMDFLILGKYMIQHLNYIHMKEQMLWQLSNVHKENSPVTQTSPEPTLLSWGGGPREKFPPPATRHARSYCANWATQTLLFSKPLDLAQVCHWNKICSKPALTWKLTLVLAFSAHCISN